MFSAFLAGVPVPAQLRPPRNDPRIKTHLTVENPTVRTGQPIVIDVHVENLEPVDVRKNQFSPISSLAGLPSFRIAPVPEGEEVLISPGLFVEGPGDWDGWYQPATGRDAFRVDAFILRARTRLHLLHGDLRLMIEQAGTYCRQRLNEGTLLEQPEARATKKYYQDLVRLAGRFNAGGAFDLTVWAYVESNTVRIRIDP